MLNVGKAAVAIASVGTLFASQVNAATDDAVALINGQKVTDTELTQYASTRLSPIDEQLSKLSVQYNQLLTQLKTQKQQMKEKSLDALIEQKVIEAEAKRKNLTVDKLMAVEVRSKIATPSDAAIEGYYFAQRDRLGPLTPELRAQLKQQIMNAKTSAAREAYVARLISSTKIVRLIEPLRVAVTADPRRIRGAADAPVTIVEFSDYQCPFCGRAEKTLQAILAKYPGKVRLSYRDYPLEDLHPDALAAAEASHCALAQGKFWEFHDLLFANQENLTRENFLKYAKQVGAKDAEFGACLDAHPYTAEINTDRAAGDAAGVSGTPGFFVNGIFMNGDQPMENFEKVIDAELARLAQKKAG